MPELALRTSQPRSFCTFRADQRLYGIDVASLQEISTNITTTPVPPSPPAIRGLANLRSRVHLILDVRPLLGIAPIESTADSRLIILKPTVAEDTGLLVDRGGDILAVAEDRIEAVDVSISSAAGSSGEETGTLVVGICKLEKELLMIIDAMRLMGTVAKMLK